MPMSGQNGSDVPKKLIKIIKDSQPHSMTIFDAISNLILTLEHFLL